MLTEVTPTSTRPVENVITTKGLQDRNNLLLDGRTVENKGQLILTFMEQPVGKVLLGRPTVKWEDNINIEDKINSAICE